MLMILLDLVAVVALKAYTGTRFGVWRKYEGMTGLVMAYLWNVLTVPRFFLMDYSEAAGLIPQRQKSTPSWNKPQGSWSWNKAPRHLTERLNEFENRWNWLRVLLQNAQIKSRERGTSFRSSSVPRENGQMDGKAISIDEF